MDLNTLFFDEAPEPLIILDKNFNVFMFNKKSKMIFDKELDINVSLYSLNLINNNNKNIFDPSTVESYFEFDFENREITYEKQDNFTLYFLLSHKKITINNEKYSYISFKNITDMFSFKKIFEELYDSLSAKTIELDNTILEKERAYKLLKQKDDEMLRQLNLASEVQKGIFSEINGKYQDYYLSSRLRAATIVSGDCLSVSDLDDKYLDIVIADVTGHGVPSALITMLLKMSLQMRREEQKTPEAIVEAVKNDMHKILSSATIFVTLLLARLEYSSGNIDIIDCGHTPPVIVRSNSKVEQIEINGMMLGVMENLDAGHKRINLAKNDMIFFITDGIIEAQNENGEFYEPIFYKKISTLIDKNPDYIVDYILKDVYQFTKREDLSDDATIVCLKRV